MIDRIKNRLIQNNYAETPSSLKEFTIFYQSQEASVNIVHIIDYHSNFVFTKEQYLHIKEQIVSFFQQKGFRDIKLFTLFVTENIEAAHKVNEDDPLSWIYDTNQNRILIYETQVSDFYGIRGLLEQASQIPPQRKGFKQIRLLSFLENNPAPMNTALVFLNIIVFLGLEIFGSTVDLSYMVEKGALFPPYLISRHQYYRLFTCMFLHFGYAHLAYNMLALYFLGEYVEPLFGKGRYLILYLFSGLGASSFSLIYALLKENTVVSAGASGAVFGVIGALLYIVIHHRGHFENITLPKLLLFIGYSIFSGVTSAEIDNAAHIGGLIAGFILAVLLYGEKEDVAYEN